MCIKSNMWGTGMKISKATTNYFYMASTYTDTPSFFVNNLIY